MGRAYTATLRAVDWPYSTSYVEEAAGEAARLSSLVYDAGSRLPDTACHDVAEKCVVYLSACVKHLSNVMSSVSKDGLSPTGESALRAASTTVS